MANSIEYIYEVIDRFSGPLRKFERATERASNDVRKMSARMKDVGERMQNVAGAIGGAAIVGAFGKFANQSIRVEDALADIMRVSDLSGASLADFEARMEALSQELGKDKIGLLQQAFEGLKLGIPTDEIEEFVNLGARVAVAFDMMDESAGRVLGSIRAKLGLTTSSTDSLLDSVNFVADNFATSGERMIEIIERTSGTMRALKIPPSVIAGIAGFADQIEVTPELAASGLNQMFARMQRNPSMAKKLLEDPIAAVNEEFQKFLKIPAERRVAMMTKMYDARVARFLNTAMTNVDLFNQTVEAAQSKDAVGSMLREMANRANRTSTFISILGAVFSNTFEAIGDANKPALRVFVNMAISVGELVKEFVQANPLITQAVSGILILVAAVSLVLFPLGVMITMIGATFGPIMVTASFAVGLMSKAFALFNLVLLANPIGLVILGIAALIALGYVLYQNWDAVTEVFSSVWQWLKDTASAIYEVVEAIPNWIFGGGKMDVGHSIDSDNTAQKTANRRERQDTMRVDGSIGVRGENGATVTESSINLNGGANVATAQ